LSTGVEAASTAALMRRHAPERGGRRKIYYRITAAGRRALKDLRKVHAALWADAPLFGGPEK
jgi:DNA-binding PadR family transcriptional regulator